MTTNERLQCPKWDGCNAPTCPLDPNVGNCQTQRGEAVCLWLREGMKPGGESRIPEAILPKIREALPLLLQKNGAAVLRGKLLRASQTGSKIALGRTRGNPRTGEHLAAGAVTPAATQGKQGGYFQGGLS